MCLSSGFVRTGSRQGNSHSERETDRQIDRESPEDGITIAAIGNLRPSVFSIISSCYELSRCSIGLSAGVRFYMCNYMSDDSYFLHIII